MSTSDLVRQRVAEAALEGTVAPGGPVLERFAPVALAAALEQEAHRATLWGQLQGSSGKVTVALDPRDALELAAFLRRNGG